jgi:hypothetical protein
VTLIETLKGAGLLTPRYLERLEEEEAERRATERERRISDAEEGADASGDADAAEDNLRDVSNEAPREDVVPHLVLLRLCDAGALVGGLTVDLDVRPDELVGPITALVGGSAVRLRVTDVHDGPPLKLTVFFQDHEESWELEDLYPFVQDVNDLLKDDPRARVVAILGEWEDSLQLWAVEKKKLPWLFKQRWFHPRNRHQLEAQTR